MTRYLYIPAFPSITLNVIISRDGRTELGGRILESRSSDVEYLVLAQKRKRPRGEILLYDYLIFRACSPAPSSLDPGSS